MTAVEGGGGGQRVRCEGVVYPVGCHLTLTIGNARYLV